MSGIYIKGMEMPPSCGRCRFAGVCGVHSVDEWPDIESIMLNDVIGVDGTRDANCPLVPVPDHGRLIDADELRQSIKDSIDACHNWADEIEGGEMYARVSQALGTFVECSLRVKAAPTIIPAENEDV